MNRRPSIIFVRDILSVSEPIQKTLKFIHFVGNCVLRFWKIIYFFAYAVQSTNLSDFKNNLRIWTWYVSIRIGLKRKCKEDLLQWINALMKDSAFVCKNFTSDWHDGIALCALSEAVFPGSFPRYDLLNPSNAEENIKLGLNVLESLTSFNSLLTPKEILSHSSEMENKLIMLMLMLKIAITQEKTNVTCVKLQDNLPKLGTQRGFIAKGMGLMQAVCGRKACFNIYFKSNSDLNIVIEIKGPRNSTCSKLITNRSPRTTKRDETNRPKLGSTSKTIILDYELYPKKLHVSFVPVHSGKHHLSIVWQGSHMMGSPYYIHVAESIDQDSSSSPGPKKLTKLLSLHKMPSFDVPDEDFDEWYLKETTKVQEMGAIKKRKLVRQVVIVNGEEVMFDDQCQHNRCSSKLESVDKVESVGVNVSQSKISESESGILTVNVNNAVRSSRTEHAEANGDEELVSEIMKGCEKGNRSNLLNQNLQGKFRSANGHVNRHNDNGSAKTEKQIKVTDEKCANTTSHTSLMKIPLDVQKAIDNLCQTIDSEIERQVRKADDELEKSDENTLLAVQKASNLSISSNMENNVNNENVNHGSYNITHLSSQSEQCDQNRNILSRENEEFGRPTILETEKSLTDDDANDVGSDQNFSNSESILINKDMLIVQYSSFLPNEIESRLNAEDKFKSDIDLSRGPDMLPEDIDSQLASFQKSECYVVQDIYPTGENSSTVDIIGCDGDSIFCSSRKRKSLQWSDIILSKNELATSSDSTCILVDSFSTPAEAEMLNCEDALKDCISESHTYHDKFIKRQGFWENISTSGTVGKGCEKDKSEGQKSLVQEKKEFWEKRLK